MFRMLCGLYLTLLVSGHALAARNYPIETMLEGVFRADRRISHSLLARECSEEASVQLSFALSVSDTDPLLSPDQFKPKNIQNPELKLDDHTTAVLDVNYGGAHIGVKRVQVFRSEMVELLFSLGAPVVILYDQQQVSSGWVDMQFIYGANNFQNGNRDTSKMEMGLIGLTLVDRTRTKKFGELGLYAYRAQEDMRKPFTPEERERRQEELNAFCNRR